MRFRTAPLYFCRGGAGTKGLRDPTDWSWARHYRWLKRIMPLLPDEMVPFVGLLPESELRNLEAEDRKWDFLN